LLLSPSGWVRWIQFAVVESGGISFCFSSSSKPDQFITICCGVEILSPQILSFPLPAFLKKGGMVRAMSPWYLVAWNTSFVARSTVQAYDLCFLSLSNLSCCFSLCCMLRPRGLVSESSRVLGAIANAPSRRKGPEAIWIVAIPCAVTALMRPLVVSQNSVFSKIRTTPISGEFLMMLKMSSNPRFLSTNVSGSLDAWGTENHSLSSFCCFLSSFCSFAPLPMCVGVTRFFLNLCCRSCVIHAPAVLVVYCFPVLFFFDVSSHVFLHLWMDWPLIFVRDHRESQFWECEPEPWRLSVRYYFWFCAGKRKCHAHLRLGGVSV